MRVNVDDVAFMDRRFKLLGGRLAMTWQEALGRCLPVWALAYQRRSAVLPAGDVDALAERPGFAAAMIEVELALAEGDAVYLCGVTERIDFLLIQDAKRERARAAKLAAAGVPHPRGRSRGNPDMPGNGPAGRSRGTSPGEGPYSPDLAPDLAPEDQNLSLPRAIPQPVPQPAPVQVVQAHQQPAGGAGPAAPSAPVPAVSPPAPAREDIARTHGAECPSQTANGQIRPFRPAAVEATLCANPPPAPIAPFDPADPRALGRLGDATYRRVSDARIAIAAELKLPAPIPFPAITPSSETRGLTELRARIREEGALAPAACDRVVENAVKQARAKRSIDWLGERLFGDKAWGNARDGIDPSARSPAPGRRGDPPASPARRPDPDPPPVVSTLTPEERLALAAQARSELYGSPGGPAAMPTHELVKRFGGARAGPESAHSDDDTPPDEKPRRKAAK